MAWLYVAVVFSALAGRTPGDDDRTADQAKAASQAQTAKSTASAVPSKRRPPRKTQPRTRIRRRKRRPRLRPPRQPPGKTQEHRPPVPLARGTVQEHNRRPGQVEGHETTSLRGIPLRWRRPGADRGRDEEAAQRSFCCLRAGCPQTATATTTSTGASCQPGGRRHFSGYAHAGSFSSTWWIDP